MKSKYNKTITACFVGYIVQAIVNNYVAGNLQQGIGDSSEGRHHAVCTSGAWRRYRLFRWTDTRGTDFKSCG